MEVSTKPNPQKAHYEAIHDAYEAHYYDAPSMAYRDRFIYGPLVKRLDLSEASDTTPRLRAATSPGFARRATISRRRPATTMSRVRDARPT